MRSESVNTASKMEVYFGLNAFQSKVQQLQMQGWLELISDYFEFNEKITNLNK